MDVERRRAPRYRLVAEAEIVEWRSGAKIAARTSEVSLFGCFLNSQHSFPEGTRIQLTLRKQGASFTSCGVIARVHPMGMGVGFVPIRALALYNHRRKLVRIPLIQKFSRELVVVTRKRRKAVEHIEKFVSNVLF